MTIVALNILALQADALLLVAVSMIVNVVLVKFAWLGTVSLLRPLFVKEMLIVQMDWLVNLAYVFLIKLAVTQIMIVLWIKPVNKVHAHKHHLNQSAPLMMIVTLSLCVKTKSVYLYNVSEIANVQWGKLALMGDALGGWAS
jgi:hypothetical protein